ncbi:MAG: hypothetical protein Q7S58_04055 [Candidatus Binatus sp.]|uniref:hypothetical protein n=1 Tax=Candidatus Binatus sp. TaxID=2811406 RepID=UPI00271887C6|nr:hypothetical protein [Candidatus Binatus sp.]MDO8431564.1 hypothetical protein [Candidatus Binatus sp.]
MGERILKGESFKQSNNDYDWLGPGIYFWEANPLRGFDFAREAKKRRTSDIRRPFAIGAVISLGGCLDLTTTAGVEQVRTAYRTLAELAAAGRFKLPQNAGDGLLRRLDCAVIQMVHTIRADRGEQPIDAVKGVFIEGLPVYKGSGFYERTHIQIAVRNPDCIKGVFRVPQAQLRSINR